MSFVAISLVGPFLDVRERHNTRAVSRAWKAAVELRSWGGTSFPQKGAPCSACKKSATVHYRAFNTMIEGFLNISLKQATWSQLEDGEMSGVRTFRVDRSTISGSLAGLHNLRTLDLGISMLELESLESIRNLTGLTALDIGRVMLPERIDLSWYVT